jgi:uncharacterized protein
MAIVSMLFGAGIVLMAERREAKGESATGLHYRRMVWLIVFGLLHAHLLWYGDILYWYGMCGLGVYLLRRVRRQRQIALGVASLAIGSMILVGGGLAVDTMPPAQVEEMVAEFAPPPAAIAAEIEAYRGGWLEQISRRVPTAVQFETGSFLLFGLWRA